MANKKILSRVLVMALTFGIVLIGCDTGTGENLDDEKNETWRIGEKI
jgi:hypothetical protein